MPALTSINEPSALSIPPRLAAVIHLHPRIGPRFNSLYTQVMFARGILSLRERAMIAAVCAIAQHCSYLEEAFTEWLCREGADPQLVTSFLTPTGAIKEVGWYSTTRISARDQVLCQIADKLTRTPTQITPEDWQPLLDSGADPLELIEIAHVVGLSNYITRLAEGFRISADHPAITIDVAKYAHRNIGVSTSDRSTHARADYKRARDVSSLGWFLKVRAEGAPKDSPYNFGYRSEMGMLLGAHPRIGPAFWALFSEIMFSPGVLTRAEREMVAAVAAAAQDCHY
jgi:alkylhydroperoxidase/carboxymuconolactone decarboxylase family protein YurZ